MDMLKTAYDLKSNDPYIIDSIRDVNDKVVYSNDNPIVCPFCEFNGKISFEKITRDDFVAKEEDNLKLQQMADIIDIFKPDASVAPELFNDIAIFPINSPVPPKITIFLFFKLNILI